ncbi:hypothetical protein mRhiFer1_008933 [Rhinolophus ferrumequinum]|uniref:Uncharacterized protein n=1 Tax=Rhinolophus ferrumequinum TaxID=59479 RepID=A0A7J7TDV1_RHIFE|nr:hypothetical protein mRhiFer1_008933 [Rhinolophus ferrumequinum]
MENPVQWRQGRRRHADNDPKPCGQNTACAAEQSRGSLQEERSPRTTALRFGRGGPGMPLPVSPSRWLPALVTREREAPSRSANVMWHHVLPGSTLQAFLESGLFSQVDSGVWRKGLRVVLMQVGKPVTLANPLPCPSMHTLRQSRKAGPGGLQGQRREGTCSKSHGPSNFRPLNRQASVSRARSITLEGLP